MPALGSRYRRAFLIYLPYYSQKDLLMPTKPQYAFPSTVEQSNKGMTLRDYFAAKALEALAEKSYYENGISNTRLAKHVYDLADAMMEARKNA